MRIAFFSASRFLLTVSGKVWTCVIVTLLVVVPCHAGSQAHRENSRFSTEELTAFSKRVERHAAQQGARAFFIARLGTPEDILPEGIKFTHVGLAIYSVIETQSDKKIYGYAVHNLYQDAEHANRSNLVQDYPMDFFAGAEKLKAGILIPHPTLQEKLITALNQGVFQAVHQKHYSVIANPFTENYQNCTEHMLDFTFAAIYQTQDWAQIKANERAWFKAQRLNLSPIKQALVSVFTPDIYTRDHPGPLETTTFTTLANFLISNGLAQRTETIE